MTDKINIDVPITQIPSIETENEEGIIISTNFISSNERIIITEKEKNALVLKYARSRMKMIAQIAEQLRVPLNVLKKREN